MLEFNVALSANMRTSIRDEESEFPADGDIFTSVNAASPYTRFDVNCQGKAEWGAHKNRNCVVLDDDKIVC